MKYLRIKQMETVGRMAAYFFEGERELPSSERFQAYPLYPIDDAV
jgi:hypothetical protein